MNNKQFAGKPIAAGGFGCVFEPSLKCKNNTQNVSNGISKLMIKNDMINEFSEFKRVQKYTKDIPNNSNYFLLSGIKKCDSLKPLTKNDLISILLSNSPFQSSFKNEPQYGPRSYSSNSKSLWHDLNLGAPVIEPPGQQAFSKSIQFLPSFNFPLITEVR